MAKLSSYTTITSLSDADLVPWLKESGGSYLNRTTAYSNLIAEIAAKTKTLTNTTFDANGTGNSVSNVETADIAAGSKSGADSTIVTGTAGADGNLAQWNADGDAVDSSIAASGVLVDGNIGSTVQGYDADTLKADTADQLTAGYTEALDDDGTQSSGTYTPDADTGNTKAIVNGGAFTLAPPSAASGEAIHMTLLVTNNASAGAITTSGFTLVNGDSFTTANGDDFLCSITVIKKGGTTFSELIVRALQ